MELILLRHFRVLDTCDKRVFNTKEIDLWVERYDTFDLAYHDIVLPDVDKVYTSALSRAKRSAEHLSAMYESTPLLNEVSAKAFFDTKWRFPKLLWLLVGRVYWSFGWVRRSESKKETFQRARTVVEMLGDEKHARIMIVSHGFFMRVLEQVLKEQGFVGEMDRHPKNGKPYYFRRV